MARLSHRVLFFLTLTFACASYAEGQDSIYYLHKEASSTGALFQLESAGPDGTTWAVQSAPGPSSWSATTASNVNTFTALTTGTISGRITAADGTTPIPGATVKALQGATILATITTNSDGDYTIAPIDAGTYTITASATGYGTKSRSLVIVSGAETVTVNLSLDAIVNGAVSYIYDAAGRLISTVGPAETTIYGYDAVGNLLSISRQPSSQLSIISVVPSSGSVGQLVTINGTGFSGVASENTVQFNGTAASVVSATNTRIITNVPSLSVTGLIQIAVTTGQGTVTAPFTVLPTSTEPSVELAPRYVSLLPAEKLQFIASVNGITGDQSVTWSVNGISGGNADVGTISSTGLYASPNQPSFIFAIRATSVANPNVFGQAQVAILNPSYAQQLNPRPLSVLRAAITDVASITAVSVQRKAQTEIAPIATVSVLRKSTDVFAFTAGPVAVRLSDGAISGSTQSANVSLTNGPYIQSMSPGSGAKGTSFTLTINGTNLDGVTGLTLLTTSGTVDSGITASGITVNAEGTSLTATVTVSAGTTVGQRIVVVTTATIHSLEMDVGPNVIQITQ